MIENGYVYTALAPLYKITKTKGSVYLSDDSELKQYMEKHKNEKFEVSHFKGLGEMSPEELKDTTLDIEQRRLKQILFSDENSVKDTIDVLMGTKVIPRKDFITENAYRANISI